MLYEDLSHPVQMLKEPPRGVAEATMRSEGQSRTDTGVCRGKKASLFDRAFVVIIMDLCEDIPRTRCPRGGPGQEFGSNSRLCENDDAGRYISTQINASIRIGWGLGSDLGKCICCPG
jgi:hypothetical protein